MNDKDNKWMNDVDGKVRELVDLFKEKPKEWFNSLHGLTENFSERIIQVKFELENILTDLNPKKRDLSEGINNENTSPLQLCSSNTLNKQIDLNLKKEKKKIRKCTVTHMEINKTYLSCLFEQLNRTDFKIDLVNYRKMVVHSFDFLPQINQKISALTSNKDLYIGILTFIFKIAIVKQEMICASAKQKILGIPSIMPIKYGTDGPLLSKLKPKSKNRSKKKSIKKGIFCFEEDQIHLEVVRLLRRINITAEKQFTSLMSMNREQNDIDKFENPVKELIQEIKEKTCANISVLHYTNHKIQLYVLPFAEYRIPPIKYLQ